MKKFIAYFSALVSSMILLASCSTSDADTVTEQSFPQTFAYVIDMTDDASAVYSQVGYTLRLNYTKLTAEVVINNLRLTDGNTYPTITISDIPWTLDPEGYYIVSGTNLTGRTNSGVSSLLFSSFRLTLVERVVEGRYSPGFVISYSVNSRYSVMSANADQVIFGETTSVDSTGKAFKTDKTIYNFQFNMDTRRAKITMLNSQFHEKMPALNIVLENVPFKFDGNSVTWDAEEVVPKIGDVAYQSFMLSNVKGTFSFGKTMTMSFSCTPPKAEGKYTVSASCKFNYVPKQDK